ncbi:MAG: hypothetical protein JO142_08090 [Burkholderiales bacterium]|nr:hypothetical protein [Burkholderiales bacterium]
MRSMLCLMLLFCLAACGGGGGGGSSGGGTPTPTALVIAAVTPSAAAPGATLSVTGAGFSGVTAAKVGGVSASFTITSDTALTLIVPATANSGVIELDTATSAVQSTQSVTVQAPTVSGLSPSSALVGGTVIVQGSYLDQVTAVSLNGVSIPFSNASSTALTLTIPANAQSGFLVLGTASGAQRTVSIQLTILAPITVTAVTPAAGIVGSTLTLTGTGLNRVTQVLFTGGATAMPASQTGTQLTVTVPAGAASGALSLQANPDGVVATGQSWRLASTITVSSMSPIFGIAGTVVQLAGTGFTEVSGVAVNGTTASFTAQSATALSFTVPAAATSGAVVLHSSSQPDVTAGTFSVGAVQPASVARIDVAQTYSQQTTDPYQRLVPGKPALVRAYVLGQAGQASPTVTLAATANGQSLGSLTMTGPSTLPAAQAPYDASQTFNATLPANWVTNGLKVSVSTSQAGSVGATASPTVGLPTNLKLVLVPLIAGTQQASVPTVARARRDLLRALPFADATVTISVRQAYTLTSVTAPPKNNADWSAILSELESLRSSEAPGQEYFGLVPNPNIQGSQIVGLAYVNSATTSRADSAIGLEPITTFSGFDSTFIHELSHNFSRMHAPCGNPSNVDPNYPYAAAALSSTPLYDSTTSTLSNPAGGTDLMAYCNGSWLSDYNYKGAQVYLESNTYTASAASVQSPEVDMLIVRGEIRGGVVTFFPLTARRGQVPVAVASDHQLAVMLADGTTRTVPVHLIPVADGGVDTYHFTVAMPHPGPLAALNLLQGHRAYAQRSTPNHTVSSAPSAAQIHWQEQGGNLVLDWNAQRFPRLTVTQVGAARHVLAVDLADGHALLSIAGIPAGGQYEFAAANDLDVRLLTANR